MLIINNVDSAGEGNIHTTQSDCFYGSPSSDEAGAQHAQVATLRALREDIDYIVQ